MTEDLPARWRSAEWRAGAQDWLCAVAEADGRTVTGPVEQPRVRFWSTQLTVPTDRGLVWFKENCPSQAFEAALVQLLSRLDGAVVPPVLGVELERGWLATADLGEPARAGLPDDAGPQLFTRLYSDFSVLQRRLAERPEAVLATGVPELDAAGTRPRVEEWVESLRALPASHPQHLDDDRLQVVRSGLPEVVRAADELAGSGIPSSLDHNDLHLGNALNGIGERLALIDFADAVWAHPFTVFRLADWSVRTSFGVEPGSAEHRRLVDAYLDPWTGYGSLRQLRALLPAAERLSCLHRSESYRRIMADVPDSCIEPRFADAHRGWLVTACASVPFDDEG